MSQLLRNCMIAEIVIDDLGEKYPICEICHRNPATIKFKKLHICRWCYEDFSWCD